MEPGRRHCLAKATTLAALAAGTRGVTRAERTAASIAATLLDGKPFASEAPKGKVQAVNFWAS